MKACRFISMFLLAFNGIGALYGGYSLITDPTGGSLQMPVSVLKTGPFNDFLIPGIILFTVLGLGCMAALVMMLFRTRLYTQAVLLCGIATIIWIATQIFMLQGVYTLQVIIGSVGVLLIICSYGLSNAER